jgi:hypothetical protein
VYENTNRGLSHGAGREGDRIAVSKTSATKAAQALRPRQEHVSDDLGLPQNGKDKEQGCREHRQVSPVTSRQVIDVLDPGQQPTDEPA